MKLFVGLGNPGTSYAKHRHNVGFMAVDRIAETHGFGPWRNRFQGMVSEGRLGSQKCLLLKPQTFMNESGRSVGEAVRFYKLDPHDVVVFHDELDLAPGKLKVRSGGGTAGHNGLKSLAAQIGGDFTRVRIGIGHPGHRDKVSGYVLHDFPKADREWLEPLLEAIAEAAPRLADDDAAGFMNAVALKVTPPMKEKRTAGERARSKTEPQASGRTSSPDDGAGHTPAPSGSPFARLKKLFTGGQDDQG
ncbi:MAG: aminoacyl-tRNA hydrolase [Alphaproteobacteria bacterium]|nr:MAG: aminoacyl-tRNA hydrolase [Alphaproteobacteria bacterium]